MKDDLKINGLIAFYILLGFMGITLFIFFFSINGVIALLFFTFIAWLFGSATRDLLNGEW